MPTNNPFSIKSSKSIFGPSQQSFNPTQQANAQSKQQALEYAKMQPPQGSLQSQQADQLAKQQAGYAQLQPQGSLQEQQMRESAAADKARTDAGQANMTAMNQTAARNVAMQGAKSQNAPAMASGREVMQRPPTLQPVQGGLVDGQATKTGVNPENRNIKQTMGTGIIAAQMNRPA